MIMATSLNGGIGRQGVLPWHFSSDMNHFSKLTTGTNGEKNALICGRSTWESIPTMPLKNRDCYMLSRKPRCKDCKHIFSSLHTFHSFLLETPTLYDTIWIIGGEKVYTSYLESKYANHIDKLYLTKIYTNYECDTFMKDIPPKNYTLIDETYTYEKNTKLGFFTYQNPNYNG